MGVTFGFLDHRTGDVLRPTSFTDIILVDDGSIEPDGGRARDEDDSGELELDFLDDLEDILGFEIEEVENILGFEDDDDFRTGAGIRFDTAVVQGLGRLRQQTKFNNAFDEALFGSGGPIVTGDVRFIVVVSDAGEPGTDTISSASSSLTARASVSRELSRAATTRRILSSLIRTGR